MVCLIRFVSRLISVCLSRVGLCGVCFLRVGLFRVSLLWISIYGVSLCGVSLLVLSLCRVSLFRIGLFTCRLLRIVCLILLLLCFFLTLRKQVSINRVDKILRRPDELDLLTNNMWSAILLTIRGVRDQVTEESPLLASDLSEEVLLISDRLWHREEHCVIRALGKDPIFECRSIIGITVANVLTIWLVACTVLSYEICSQINSARFTFKLLHELYVWGIIRLVADKADRLESDWFTLDAVKRLKVKIQLHALDLCVLFFTVWVVTTKSQCLQIRSRAEDRLDIVVDDVAA